MKLFLIFVLIIFVTGCQIEDIAHLPTEQEFMQDFCDSQGLEMHTLYVVNLTTGDEFYDYICAKAKRVYDENPPLCKINEGELDHECI